RTRRDGAAVLDRLASRYLPGPARKIGSRFLHVEKDAGAADRCFDLCARTDDAGVVKEAGNILFAKTRNLCRIEVTKGSSEGFSLAQHDDPRQPRLKAFEHEAFPQGAAVEIRHAPLFIVICAHERIVLCPRTTNLA